MKFYCLTIILFLSSFSLRADESWKQKHQPTNDDWKKTKQHFIFNNGAEPQSLDPALISGLLEFRLIESMFEGLTTLDPETLEPKPAVAEKWTISKDGLIYTFHIRATAKWSNGTAITADDFFQSWERVLNPKTPAEYKYQLYPIKNAQQYAEGKITNFSEVGIKILDPQTLQVSLFQPCAYFLNLTAFQTLFPVPIKVIKEKGDKWILPENIVSNGAFKLKEWKHREKIDMVKNPFYWDKNIVKLEMITALPIDDEETSYKNFRNNELHWNPNVPLSKVKEAKHLAEYYQSESLSSSFFRLNVTAAPLNNKSVRKALSLAIDRESLTKFVLNDIYTPATWFCPPAGKYKPVAGLKFNPEEAKKLLKESGVKFPIQVSISFANRNTSKVIAEYIKEQWKNNLGVDTELKSMEWKTYLENMSALRYEAIAGGWFADYNDPNSFLDMFVTDGGNNRTGWSNKTYDDLLIKAQAELDPEKRMKIFQQMESILVEDEFPIIPLYISTSQGLISGSVNGFYENLLSFHPLKYVWLED